MHSLNYHISLFDYNAKDIDKRIVGDLVVNVDFVKEEVLGFRNQGSNITDNITDGILNYKNFYGTYLLGPILVRNPISQGWYPNVGSSNTGVLPS